MLPLASTAIWKDPSVVGTFEISAGAENVRPPSDDRLKKTSPGKLFCQARLTLPVESTAIWNVSATPLETSCGAEKTGLFGMGNGTGSIWLSAPAAKAARTK